MPNHIYNIVSFDCSSERANEILESVRSSEGGLGSIDFNKLIPMPENVYRGPLGVEEMKKYPGDLNWYDFSVGHWGSKWNAYGFDELPSKEGCLVFNTAWSAVPKVIKALSEKFPDVTMTYSWADEDFGSNTGQLEFKDGDVTSVYLPEELTDEAYEFAASIQDLSVEDFGMVRDAKTGKLRFCDSMYMDKMPEHKAHLKESER